jgi:type I restriction enzyme S subunit
MMDILVPSRVSAKSGEAQVRLKEDKFLRMPLSVPPFPEQKRLVAKIERLAALVEEACTVRRAAEREVHALIQSHSRKVFESLTSHPTSPLENVCLEITDCLHSNPVYADEGIPTVRSPDVGWGTLRLDTARRTSEKEYQRRTVRSEPRRGDIILVREGGGTGKAGLVEEGMRLSLGQRVMQLRPDTAQIDPKFFLLQWLSPPIQEDRIAALSKGSASPHLNIGAIRKFPLVLPPLEVQRRVTRHLDAIRDQAARLGSQHRHNTAYLDAIMPSILDRAFDGAL